MLPARRMLYGTNMGRKCEYMVVESFSSTLSGLCDKCYYKSPRIGNEMVSYHKLSGAASRARRELVEAMATRAGEERLGMKGFPPEVALYLSLLKAQGVHKRKEDGEDTTLWHLSLDGRDPNLQHLWELIDNCISKAENRGVTVAYILDELYKPPFGMRQGPAPIYVVLYLLVKSDEVAVFQEGKYLPYIFCGGRGIDVEEARFILPQKVRCYKCRERGFRCIS